MSIPIESYYSMKLESAPLLVLDNLFSKLSLNECNAIATVYKENLRKKQEDGYSDTNIGRALKRRNNIGAYLQPHFNNSTKLLTQMLFSDVVISGSRALQFFAGNGTVSSSDWDFYIPRDKDKIYRFMKYMEEYENTRWETCAENVERRLYSTDDYMSVSSAKVISDLVQKLDCSAQTKQILAYVDYATFNHVAYHIHHPSGTRISVSNVDEFRQKYTVDCISYKVSIVLGPDLTGADIDEYAGMNVINGVRTSDEGKVPIQLIVCQDSCITATLSKISEFNSSLTQCFISSFGAVHMYCNSAYEKIGIIWDQNSTKYNHTTKLFVSKYIERGYQFCNTKDRKKSNLYKDPQIIKRIIADRDCDCIDSHIRFDIDIPVNYLIAKKSELYNFSWLEYDNNISSNFMKPYIKPSSSAPDASTIFYPEYYGQKCTTEFENMYLLLITGL